MDNKDKKKKWRNKKINKNDSNNKVDSIRLFCFVWFVNIVDLKP